MNALKRLAAIATVCGALIAPAPSTATDFSFTGNFLQDDNVQFFNFVVGASSQVTLLTWSYAGGTNAAGQSIARGGFDPILALFDSTGALIGQNDDGGCGTVAMDLSGVCYDTFLQAMLAPGTYTVAIMQYDNFANGPNLSDGFLEAGNGNFTPVLATDCTAGTQRQFYDVSGSNFCQRDSHWAFDILNVAQAVQIPEPGTVALFGIALAGLALWPTRRRRS